MFRNPYADVALELYDRGLFPVPVNGDDGKVPSVKWGGNRPPRDTIAKWCERFADANVAVVMGQRSGLVVVDIDDPALIDDAQARFGDTPLMTRSPSSGAHLWYRHHGERCHNLRPHGLKIDVKGQGGLVVVPPSFNRKSGDTYRFERGSWNDVRGLPRMRPNALNFPRTVPKHRVTAIAEGGGRNDALFRWLLHEAKKIATFDDLLARAYELNVIRCDPPLPQQEVGAVAVSVWNMTQEGDNWAGGEQRVILRKSDVEMLAAQPGGGDALLMLAKFKLAHEAERKPFAVAVKAMHKADVLPGWSVERYRKGRDTLERTGHLRVVRKGGHGAHDPNQYELALPFPEGLRNPTQYNTTKPPRRPSGVRGNVGAALTTSAIADAATKTTAANTNFGTWARTQRQRRGLRQADVAHGAGLSRPTLANIEAGRFGASPQAQERLRAVLAANDKVAA